MSNKRVPRRSMEEWNGAGNRMQTKRTDRCCCML